MQSPPGWSFLAATRSHLSTPGHGRCSRLAGGGRWVVEQQSTKSYISKDIGTGSKGDVRAAAFWHHNKRGAKHAFSPNFRYEDGGRGRCSPALRQHGHGADDSTIHGCCRQPATRGGKSFDQPPDEWHADERSAFPHGRVIREERTAGRYSGSSTGTADTAEK